MPTLTKGSFSLSIGIVAVSGDFSNDDRQAAWELYCELSTRVAVTGKRNDPGCADFSGELFVESLDSLYAFFKEARSIMRKFPVGAIGTENQAHLGVHIHRILEQVLRPFLEKWHVQFRHWWEEESNPRIAPIRRQAEFPKIREFETDWSSVRQLMRAVQDELVKTYKLVDCASEPRSD